MEAKYQALSVEELNAELELVTSLLPGGNAEARQKWHETTFNANDLNNNSTIERGAEFEGLVGKLFDRFAVEKTAENYEKYFVDIDKDSDNKITFEEFTSYVDHIGSEYVVPAIRAELAKRQ